MFLLVARQHRAWSRISNPSVPPPGRDRRLAGRNNDREVGYIDPADRERIREAAEDELLGLHEGNFARYQIRPSEFTVWREAWNR